MARLAITPFSIQLTFFAGSCSLVHGFDGRRGSNGSVRSEIKSGNSLSPSLVPPPFLLRNDRPSSALRAENPAPLKPPIIRLTMSPVAVGSNTTVYLPGSRRLGFRHFMHFSAATRASSAPSISAIRVDGWPAQPELDPSARRKVVVSLASAVREKPNRPFLFAMAVSVVMRSNNPAAAIFCFCAVSMMARMDGNMSAARAWAVRSSQLLISGYCCAPRAERCSGFGGAMAASSSARFTADLMAPSSKSLTTVVPVRPSRVALMLMAWRLTSADVVIPLLANRVKACSEDVTATEHSGVVVNDRTFSASFCDCSLVSIVGIL